MDSKWKGKLKETWPSTWSTQLPESREVIIDNWQEACFSFIRNHTPWDSIEGRMLVRMRRLINSTTKKYVIVVENKRLIPRNKNLTKSEGKPFLSIEEWNSSGYIIGDGMIFEAERILATYFLWPTLLSFLLEKLKWVCKQIQPVDLYVDGMLNHYNEYVKTKELVSLKTIAPFVYIKLIRTNDILTKVSNAKIELEEQVKDAHQIGEISLKLWYHVYLNRSFGNIIVKSCATDFIFISLLNLRDCIVFNSNIKMNLWIDFTSYHSKGQSLAESSLLRADCSTPSGEEKSEPQLQCAEILHLNNLWRTIIDIGCEVGLGELVIVFTLLIMLTGTQYVDRCERIGVETMWKEIDISKLVSEKVEDEQDRKVIMKTYERLYREECPILLERNPIVTNAYLHPVTLVLKEHIFLTEFIYRLYHHMYIGKLMDEDWEEKESIKKKRQKITIEGIDPVNADVPLEILCTEFIHPPVTVDVLRRRIRTLYWNAIYWCNGWRLWEYFNPLEVHPETKLSIYGWMLDRYTDLVTDELKERIIPSPAIHVYTHPPNL